MMKEFSSAHATTASKLSGYIGQPFTHAQATVMRGLAGAPPRLAHSVAPSCNRPNNSNRTALLARSFLF